MRTWTVWALILIATTLVLPAVCGQLAVLLRFFEKDPDSVDRNPMPDELDERSFLEAYDLEPSE